MPCHILRRVSGGGRTTKTVVALVVTGLLVLPIAPALADEHVATHRHRAQKVPPPKISVPTVIHGEHFRLAGKFPSTVRRVLELQRRTQSGSWRTLRAKRIGVNAAYTFNLEAGPNKRAWRVYAPETTRSGRVWGPIRSARIPVTPIRQRATLTAAPVIHKTGGSATVRFTPSRPGRPMQLTVSSASGHVVQAAQARQDASGRATFQIAPTAYGLFDVRVSARPFHGAVRTESPTRQVRVVPIHRPLVIAHRGGDRIAPENTLPAFQSAIDAGADLIECDIQQTSDGHWVAMHDVDMLRTTNVKEVFPGQLTYRVADFTLAELQQVSVGKPGVRPPTLEQILTLVTTSKVPALIETKVYGEAAAKSILAVAAPFPGVIEPGRAGLVEFDSFDLATVKAFRALHADVRLGFISTKVPPNLPSFTWLDSLVTQYGALTGDVVAQLAALGINEYAWTVDKESDMWALADLAVDGIITDDPVLGVATTRGRR